MGHISSLDLVLPIWKLRWLEKTFLNPLQLSHQHLFCYGCQNLPTCPLSRSGMDEWYRYVETQLNSGRALTQAHGWHGASAAGPRLRTESLSSLLSASRFLRFSSLQGPLQEPCYPAKPHYVHSLLSGPTSLPLTTRPLKFDIQD